MENIDISLKLLTNSQNNSITIGNNLVNVFMDVYSAKSLKYLRNDRLVRQNENNVFLKALYIHLNDNENDPLLRCQH